MPTEREESVLLHREPCPACRKAGGDTKGDNLGRYSDGHGYCFSCGYYERGDGETLVKKTKRRSSLLSGVYSSLPARKISQETCEKFSYMVSPSEGCHIATYHDAQGKVVAQKLRFPDKEMPWTGEPKEAVLFGQHLWRSNKNAVRVVITEGELDAMSVSQVMRNSWPVVSLKNGSDGAEKDLTASLSWLEQYDEIVLCFDNDAQGQKAVEAAAGLFTPGKVRIAKLPLKDASDMLVAGRGDELLKAIWNAQEWRPESVVSFSELRERVLQEPAIGLPWPWEGLTKLTFGRRYGEVYTFGAGTGAGKTDVLTQVIQYTATECDEPCGVFFFEQPVPETGKRLAGKYGKRQFHIPNTEEQSLWTTEELEAAYETIAAKNNVFLFDHFGCSDWEVVRSHVRWMVHSLGCKHIFIDHLTALASHADDERRFLDGLMEELSSLAQELDICMYLVSHLTAPDKGSPHEEGGRVMQRHFRGSRAVAQWSHFMFGIERDQQAEDLQERRTATFRVLKDRYTGQGNGQWILLRYDPKTSELVEIEDTGFDEDDDDDDVSF